jgi:hypothetical protein
MIYAYMQKRSSIIVAVLSALVFVCSLPDRADARQPNRRKTLQMVTIAPDIGTSYGLHLRLSRMIGTRHEVGIGYELDLRNSNNYPGDFDCKSCKHGLSKEGISGMVLTYGYVIPSHPLPQSLRYVLRGGILLGNRTFPDGFQPVANPGPRDNNYTYDVRDRFAAALILRPAVEIAPGRYAGITVGPYAIFSKDFNAFGATIGVMVGRVARLGMRDELAEKRATKREAEHAGDK